MVGLSKRCNSYNVGKHHSDEAKTKMRLAKIGKPLSESHRMKISKALTGVPRSDATKEKIRMGKLGKPGISPSKETRKKLSISNIGKHNHPEEILKILREKNKGENGTNWRGGISFLPYCQKFDDNLKSKVRNFFGNKCVICGVGPENNGKKKHNLSVHHVFSEKKACCETTIENMDFVRKQLPANISQFGDPNFSEEEIVYIRMMVPLCSKHHIVVSSESYDTPYELTKYRKLFTELINNMYGGRCFS